ncbi:MAG: erythromycin esterase family protein [Planctomycetota bacterium]|nr:erythromycin esterase family protein [Planctomycetota bacterium]
MNTECRDRARVRRLSKGGLAWMLGAIGAAGFLVGGEAGCFRPPPVRVAETALRTPQTAPVLAWIAKHAIQDDLYANFTGRTGDLFDGAWVIGLGEATHGQSDTFQFKRAQTMHAVEQQGCRVVAYESSAARAIACDDYIAGRSNNLAAAMKGFGMLIWQVEENARFLDDLRRWNSTAAPADRVRFIGIDIQDPQAAIARLREVIPAANVGLIDAAAALAQRADAAAQAMMSGNPQPMDALKADLDQWGASVEAVEGLSDSAAARRSLCRMEIQAGLTMASSVGARDRAMASMLLAQMQGVDASHPMMLWAHNAHVMHAPLRYMGEAGEGELAMGGHLREALGNRYIAVGAAFGRGSFNALDRYGEQWDFRTYKVGEPRPDSLEAMLSGVTARSYVLDLRGYLDLAHVSPRVREWLDSGHGQRWFGGYNVSIDESLPLLPTFPRKDFDVLYYNHESRPTTPFGKK